MKDGKRVFRLQSAMEYLMTYGWAILIIAVVLGALFALGIFGGTGILGGATCVASPGWLCQSPTLLPTGNLSFILGQNTGAIIYNVAAACTASTQTNGQPNPLTWPVSGATCIGTGSSMAYLSGAAATVGQAQPNCGPGGTVVPSPANALASPLSMANGQQVTVSGLTCFNTANPGNALRGAAIGTSFTGSIWVNYTLHNAVPCNGQPLLCPAGPANPMLIQKIATVSLKVV